MAVTHEIITRTFTVRKSEADGQCVEGAVTACKHSSFDITGAGDEVVKDEGTDVLAGGATLKLSAAVVESERMGANRTGGSSTTWECRW